MINFFPILQLFKIPELVTVEALSRVASNKLMQRVLRGQRGLRWFELLITDATSVAFTVSLPVGCAKKCFRTNYYRTL